jgi:hypothetical protein
MRIDGVNIVASARPAEALVGAQQREAFGEIP